MPVMKASIHMSRQVSSVSAAMRSAAWSGVRAARSFNATRGAVPLTAGLRSMTPSNTASSRALCRVRHALPAVPELLPCSSMT